MSKGLILQLRVEQGEFVDELGQLRGRANMRRGDITVLMGQGSINHVLHGAKGGAMGGGKSVQSLGLKVKNGLSTNQEIYLEM